MWAQTGRRTVAGGDKRPRASPRHGTLTRGPAPSWPSAGLCPADTSWKHGQAEVAADVTTESRRGLPPPRSASSSETRSLLLRLAWKVCRPSSHSFWPAAGPGAGSALGKGPGWESDSPPPLPPARRCFQSVGICTVYTQARVENSHPVLHLGKKKKKTKLSHARHRQEPGAWHRGRASAACRL